MALQIVQADFRKPARVHDHIAVRVRDIEETDSEGTWPHDWSMIARGQVISRFDDLLRMLEDKGVWFGHFDHRAQDAVEERHPILGR